MRFSVVIGFLTLGCLALSAQAQDEAPQAVEAAEELPPAPSSDQDKPKGEAKRKSDEPAKDQADDRAQEKKAKDKADAKAKDEADEKAKSKEKPKSEKKAQKKADDKPKNKPQDKPKAADKPKEKAQDKPKAKPKDNSKDKAKLAITELSEAKADPDFHLQGEYLGWLNDRFGVSRSMGLQVVAGGDGKFDAVLLPGGLPATGWNRIDRIPLKGQTSSDGLLELAGDEYREFVSYNKATVFDAQGNQLGDLKKIRRRSPTLGLQPPPGAYVVFNGSNTDEFSNNPKLTPDGNLLAGALTKATVGDFRLHLEFCTPYMPYARGQGRSNSGVYIQQRYEVQILDSFGLEGIENECAALYKQQRPDLNMALPPLTWQTYDIYFSAPRFAGDGKTKVSNARITVLHNGVPVHLHREIIAKTGGGKAEGAEAFPINLQDHSNPVMFRNIWMVPNQGDYAFGGTSVYCPPPTRGLLWRRCR